MKLRYTKGIGPGWAVAATAGLAQAGVWDHEHAGAIPACQTYENKN